ncbi:MAG TPA: NAD(P)H-dependent oxidoreductase [Candidatus Saccharimonadales bacterium]
MSKLNIAVITGSLQKNAYSKKLYAALQERAPEAALLTLLDFSKLPLFNEELEANFPKEATNFKKAIEAADAILFITPEYNRSIPGVLKNAIDWGSRPYAENSWAQKPAGIIGSAASPSGAFGAIHHLRHVLAYLDMHTMAQPEFYIPAIHEKFDENGALIDKAVEAHISTFWQAFVPYIQRFQS